MLLCKTTFIGCAFHDLLPPMQAVPLSARKSTGGSPEGIAPFLQLPHVSETIIKKVARKVYQHCVPNLANQL